MTRFLWTDQAVEDLQSIRRFIERDSLRYARLVVERLYEATGRLELFPRSGRVVPGSLLRLSYHWAVMCFDGPAGCRLEVVAPMLLPRSEATEVITLRAILSVQGTTTRLATFAGAGLIWGGIAYLLGGAALGTAILGGVAASPFIGITVGYGIHPRFAAAASWKRLTVALLSLYIGAALFGLSVGAYDWLSRLRRPEVVVQGVVAVLYGTTVFLIALWPLAYLTHLALATDVRWWRRP